MKYILPTALLLFSLAVLATGLKTKTSPENATLEQDVKSTIIVGKDK